MHSTAMKEREINNQDRRLVRRILLDLVIVVVLIVPIIICEFLIVPFHRGFFCNDETIRYPFHPNTITTVMLALFCTLLPAIILIAVEFTRYYRRGRANEYLLFFDKKVPVWLVEFFKHASYFTFGGVLTLNATELGKYTIGRLRPHFMSVCQPLLTDGTNCDSPQNLHRYVEDYVCMGIGYSLDDLREARISFPSGHSSLMFFAMTYLIIYLQYKFTWSGSKLLRYVLQFVLLMLAWFTALSRIIDNWHHWSDVLIGILLGVVGAVLTAIFITKDFRTPLLERLHANLPRQNTSTTLDEFAATIPAFTQRNGLDDVPPLNGASAAEDRHLHSYSNNQFCTKV